MTLLDETREDIPTQEVRILSRNNTTRMYEPSGETFEASVLDLSGRQVFEMGRDADTQMKRIFCDLVNGEPPITSTQRVDFGENDGRGWSIVSIRKIPGDDPGCIAEVEKAA